MIPPDAGEPWNDIPDPLPRRRAPEPPPPPEEPSPTPESRARTRRLAAAAAAAWLLVFAVVLGIREDVAQPAVVVQLVAWTLAFAAAVLFTVRPGRDGFPPAPRAIAAGGAALVALFAGLSGLPAHGQEVSLSLATLRPCATMALVFATPPALIAALVLRRGFLTAPALRGALIGAACGLSGAAGIHSHCAVVTFSHVLVAHGLTIVFGALAGAALASRFGRA